MWRVSASSAHASQRSGPQNAPNSYALSLGRLERFKEIKALLRKTIPVARRVLGDNDILTFQMRKAYAQSLYLDADATLNDVREAVTTLEDTLRLARRVLGRTHPTVVGMEASLRQARAVLGSREAGKRVVFKYK